MRSEQRADRGAVTAEFAIVLPAVLAVLLLGVAAILLATQRVALTSAAAELARLEARGDTAAAEAREARLGSGVESRRSREGVLHCVSLRSRPAAGLLEAVAVSAKGCAAVSDGGGS